MVCERYATCELKVVGSSGLKVLSRAEELLYELQNVSLSAKTIFQGDVPVLEAFVKKTKGTIDQLNADIKMAEHSGSKKIRWVVDGDNEEVGRAPVRRDSKRKNGKFVDPFCRGDDDEQRD